MASVRHYFCDAEEFKFQLEYRRRELEIDQRRSYFAALKIQKCFRGYRTRKFILGLHRAATILQKYIRGWLVRWHMVDILKEYIEWRNDFHYNQMATRIQSVWRGYWTRKTWPVKEIIAKNKRVAKANEEVRSKIRESFERLDERRREILDQEARKLVEYILFKLHHLISTKSIKGIYSTQNSKELSMVEKWLKGFYSYTEYSKVLYKCRRITSKPDEIPFTFKSKEMQRFEAAMRKQWKDNQPRCEPSKSVGFQQAKPFFLTEKLPPREYVRPLNAEELYNPSDLNSLLTRKCDKSKQVTTAEFDLNTFIKNLPEPESFLIGYVKKCSLHNLPE